MGFSRYALSFNGINNNVNCGINFPIGASPRTLSLWFYPTSFNNESVIGYGDFSGVGTCLYVRIQVATGFMFIIGNAADYLTSLIPNLNQWNYIAVSYDGTTYTICLNGVFETSVPIALNTPAGTNLYVGAGAQSVQLFNGIIDEVYFYNRALLVEEMLRNMMEYHNLSRNGLVLWLRMEEGSGLIAYDSGGLGNNGSLMPALTPPTWTRIKKWELRAEAGL